MLREIQVTVLRWIVGIGFFGVASWCANVGYHDARPGLLLAALLLFLCGVGAVWTTVFHFFTRPLLALVDSIFFPGGKLSRPVKNLKLPAYYLNEGRYAEALDEYLKVLRHYPDEVEAYEKAIWLYVEIFENPTEARKWMRRARRRRLVLDERIVRLAVGATSSSI